jgi:hypothetical protein
VKYKFGIPEGVEFKAGHPMVRWLEQWAERWEIHPWAFTELTWNLAIYDTGIRQQPCEPDKSGKSKRKSRRA